MLSLYNRLQAWKCLPISGGYFDQPALLMKFLEQVRLAYTDYRETQEVNRRLGEGADQDSTRPGEQAPTLTVKIPLPFDPDADQR